jgi:hypothetical protein
LSVAALEAALEPVEGGFWAAGVETCPVDAVPVGAAGGAPLALDALELPVLGLAVLGLAVFAPAVFGLAGEVVAFSPGVPRSSNDTKPPTTSKIRVIIRVSTQFRRHQPIGFMALLYPLRG